jgi:secreted PhoX family phosphatase
MDPDGTKGAGNPNGHIIRFREADQKATAKAFAWDIFLFGAEEDSGDANLSGLSSKNAFSSPDGLWFSKATGICWIQTDDGAFTDETNCMMLAAIPGQVGDGGKVTVKNKMVVNGVEQTGTQETFLGAALGDAKLRRFLVAPLGAEVTGIAETADGRTLFVNIQHPGELSKPLAASAPPQSGWRNDRALTEGVQLPHAGINMATPECVAIFSAKPLLNIQYEKSTLSDCMECDSHRARRRHL